MSKEYKRIYKGMHWWRPGGDTLRQEKTDKTDKTEQ